MHKLKKKDTKTCKVLNSGVSANFLIATIFLLIITITANAAAPGGEWWDGNYQSRKKITITTGATGAPIGYSVSFSENTASLVTDGKLRSDGKDWRIVCWNGSAWVELDRWVDDIIGDGWNTADTITWFETQAAIGASSSDDNYYVYYEYASETQSAPASISDSMGADAASKVFWYADDFEEHAASTDPDGWTDQGTEDFKVMLHGSEKWLQAQTSDNWEDGSTASSMANDGDAIWSAKLYYHQAGTGGEWGGIGVHIGNGNVGYIVIVMDGYWYRADENWGDATGWLANADIHFPLGTKGRIELVTSGTTLDAYWYNPAGYSPEKVTLFTGFNMPAGTGKMAVYVERPWTNPPNDRWIDADDVIVRRYVNPEPTTNLGSEERNSSWYGSCWQYRKKLTLNSSLVSADQTDFPVLISFTNDSDLAAGAQSDFDDVLFTKADGITKLSHEIEDFDGTNGDIVAWVKIPVLSSSVDTDIYMYYGCGTSDSQQNAADVWSNGYVGVWHLAESGNGTANEYKDSTQYGNHGQGGSGTSSQVPDRTSGGKISYGQDFTRANFDHIRIGDDTELQPSSLTTQAWVKLDSYSLTVQGIVARQYGTSSQDTSNIIPQSNSIYHYHYYGNTSGGSLTDSQWYHVVAVHDNTVSYIYVNGSRTSGTASNLLYDTNDWTFGGQENGSGSSVTENAEGILDEVRISSTIRPQYWIETEYNNQNNPGIGSGKFIKSAGNEEEPVVFANLYEGSAQIAADGYTATVDITDVTLSKSFLVFSSTVDDNRPQCTQIRGQLYDSGGGDIKIEFERMESNGCAVADIRYYVAEFTSGVNVQRGTKTTLSATTTNVTLSPTVDTSKSFPLISGFVSGTTHNGNDFIEAEITANNNLQFRRNTGDGTAKVDWQVVEFSECAVQSGTITGWTTASTTDSLSPTVDLDKSWLIYSYKTNSGGETIMERNMVRGRITADNQLTFDRDGTGSTLDLTWYLVEFENETIVQHGTEDFAAGDGQEDVTLSTAVNLESSVALGGMYMRGGKSSHDSDDNPGYGWFTYDLTASNNLQITRNASTGATADADWFVVDFEPGSGTATISSAANQTFTVGDGTTAISTITVTDSASTATINTTDDIRIRIPSGFKMVWGTDDTTATIGGGASSKVSTTVSYEDSSKTLVVDVTTDFAVGDTITISGLSFESFSAASSADNLELEVENDGAVTDLDIRTITINAAGVASISSATNQTFTVGDGTTAISAITITDDATTATITTTDDIRIRIPAGFNMVWDNDVNATITGDDASKVSSTVSYEDSFKTLVISVTTNFGAGDTITISDLSFESFSAASSADNLELEVENDDVVTDTDDKTITINAAGTSLALDDHTKCQVGDQFTLSSSVTDVMFRFELTRTNTLNVTQIDVNFTTADGVANSDVSDGELWRDENNNGVVDGGTDTQLKDNISPSSGVISFTSMTESPATTGTNYLVRATINSLTGGDGTTFSMDTTDITVSAGTKSGTVSDADHSFLDFTDIASSAGLNNTTATQAGSAAWSDMDSDGLVDVVFHGPGSGGGPRLYLNNGNDTFNSSYDFGSLSYERSLVLGDINNDGKRDAFFTYQEKLYKNTTGSSFSDITSSSGIANSNPEGAAFLDYDNDGYLDVVHPDGSVGDANLWENDGDETFTEKTSAANLPISGMGNGDYAGAADYDADGDMDIFSGKSGYLYLFRNNGNNTYTDISASSGLGNAVGLDGGAGWCLGDYDNDGDFDLLIAQQGTTKNTLMRNNGDDTFTDVTSSSGDINTVTANSRGCAAGDFDNDGDIDFYVVNDGATDDLFSNDGDNTFTEVGATVGITNNNSAKEQTSAALADIDNDGDLDVFVNCAGTSAAVLYENDLNNDKYVRVRVIGSGSGGGPKDGTGAIVYLYTSVGDFVAMRQVDGGRPFAQDEPIVHFGLPASNGGACGRYKVNVLFPGGALKTSGTFVPTDESITIGSTTLSQTVEVDESSAATVVSLVSFTATGEGNAVRVAWQTAHESDNVGFHLHRATAPGGPYTRITDKLISANPQQSKGGNYSYLDSDVTVGKLYYYKLEDIDVFGKHTEHGPICVDWDGDGMPDDWEIEHGLNPWIDDADLDSDGDGLTNLEEYRRGTDPFNRDTDGDGILDGDEDGRIERSEDPGARQLSRGIEVLEQDETGMTLELITSGFDAEAIIVGGQEFERLTIAEYVHGHTSKLGAPQLPLKGLLVDVPAGRVAQLKVLNSTVEPYYGYRIYPVPQNVLDEQGAAAAVGQKFVQDQAAYSADAFYPVAVAALGQSYVLRGQIKQQLIFYPLSFNAASGQLNFYRRIKVRIDFIDSAYAKIDSLYGTSWQPPQATAALLAPVAVGLAACPLLASPISPLLSSLGAAIAAVWSPPQDDGSKVYKIATLAEGIYRIDRAWLLAEGLDAAAVDDIDLEQVRLFNRGQEVAVYIEDQGVAGQLDAGDYIEFYAVAVAAEYAKYSAENIYWMTLSGGAGLPKRMSSIDAAPIGGQLADDFGDTVHYEQNQMYWLKAPGADSLERWVSFTFVQGDEHPGNGAPVAFTINVPDPTTTGTLKISMAGQTATEHQVRVEIDGSQLDFIWPAISYYEAIVSDVNLNAGDNTVTLQCLSSDGNDSIAVDWFEISYRRDYVAGTDNTLKFAPDSGERYVIEDFTSNSLLAYDISDPADVAILDNVVIAGANPYDIEFEPASYGDQYLVVATAAINTPDSLTVETGSTLSDTGNGADYILITHRDIGWEPGGDQRAWLDDLVDLRKAQGLRVFVADIEDIYDEFSYGIKGPHALKAFLTYAFSNWQPPVPQYVLLVGDGTYDPKDLWLNADTTPYLPAYLIFTDFKGETVSDPWFVTISGDDAVADMYIGRLPAADAAQAATMVDKIITYETSTNTKFVDPDAWEKHLLLIADNQRPGEDYNYEAAFENMNDFAADLLPDAMADPFKGYLNDYVDEDFLTDDIIDTINDGVLMVNYSGHGATWIWAEEKIFQASDVAALTNSDKWPFFVSMSCESGIYSYPEPWGAISLGEALLRSDAGAVAAFMPTGMTTTPGQEILNSALFDAIFSDDVRTLGPAIAAAKQTMLANGDAYYEQIAATFMLFGDPATTLKVPLPCRPTGVRAQRETKGRRIRWNAATDCDGNPVAGYNIYRAASAAGPFSKINPELVTDTFFFDYENGLGIASGVSGGSGYYVVSSVDSAGDESAMSLAVKPAALTSSAAGSATPGCFISSSFGMLPLNGFGVVVVLTVLVTIILGVRCQCSGVRKND